MTKRTNLETYLKTEWVVRVNLMLGFKPGEEMLLPEIALHRTGEEATAEKLTLAPPAGPLAGVAPETIDTFVRNTLLADAGSQLALMFPGDAPALERGLVELGVLGSLLVPQELRDMLRFRQSGQSNTFEAEVIQGMLHWSVTIDQSVGQTFFGAT